MSVAGVNHHALVDIAREMADHNPVRPGFFRWWADLLAWNDPYGRGYSLAHACRDAGVMYRAAQAGTMTDDDSAAMCRVLTERRDRFFAQWLADCDEYWRKGARELATLAGADTAGPIARAAADNLARADACAAALAPLVAIPGSRERGYARSPVLALPNTALPAPRSRAPFECARCSHIWIPRVDTPRKCPRCQTILLWPDDDAAEG
jgi:hypothetical protein